jgi:ectoine hydroxylase-related dioxygenase (phytanoyl-CoA dioxygenase family)
MGTDYAGSRNGPTVNMAPSRPDHERAVDGGHPADAGGGRLGRRRACRPGTVQAAGERPVNRLRHRAAQRRISVVSRRAGLLSAGQRESLERDGYLLVPSLLDDSVLAPMRARLDELVYQTLAAWDANPGQDVEERGVVHAAVGMSDPRFAPCREHPLLAEAAAVMLGPDWHLGGLGLRAPLPGCGHQGLHPDYYPGHRTHGPWRTLAAMWCISAFTPDNGPLRVIPGSHRVDRNPADALPLGCEMGPHPAEVKLIAPAGSVILFNNADLWHSGTFNYSPAPRPAVTATLVRP